MAKDLSKLYESLGCTFKEDHILITALTHRSAQGKNKSKNNERFEFLGDALLGFIIADELLKRFPNLHEGQLTRFRAVLVNGENLATLARRLGLNHYIILGPGEIKMGGTNSSSILAGALEAVIGAIYLEAGMTICRERVIAWLDEQIDQLTTLDAGGKDAKTRLQEYLQAKKYTLPVYTLIKTKGKNHQKLFFVSCQVQELDIQSTGQGTSRRKAEQSAAELFLEQVKQ